MSYLSKLFRPPERKEAFGPADENVNWTRIETLVHGPGAGAEGQRDKGDGNSAVFACLMAISLAYIEPPLRVYRPEEEGGSNTHLEMHPWQKLMDMPTPFGELSPRELWFWIAWAKHTDGNAYLLKVRSGDAESGNVVQLWPVSPSMIEPISERGEWLSYYQHQVSSNRYERVSASNVIHFRQGIDPRDMRKGLSPLKRLIRAVSTDGEADRFTDSLLGNYAVPGLVVTTKDPSMTAEEADLIKERVRTNFGNDNRGNIAVLSNGADVKQFGFSPEQMSLEALHRIPEERISATIGIPAILAGLGAGLDSATYSNAQTLRGLFTETRLVPMWNMDAEKITQAIRADMPSDRRVYAAFDLSDVRALQEDEDTKYARLTAAVTARIPWIRVNEARTDVGLPPDDELEALQIEKAKAPPAVPAIPQGQEGDKPAEGEEEKPPEEDDAAAGGKGAEAFFESKANRALLRAFPELLGIMAELAATGMEKDMDAYLSGLRKRVNGKVRA